MNLLWKLLFIWTISGHAPTHELSSSISCYPDDQRPAETYAIILYRFGEQAPSWHPGCELDSTCWKRVVAETAPIQYMSVACTDGQPFSFTITDTTRKWVYYAVARDIHYNECFCWSKVVRRP